MEHLSKTVTIINGDCLDYIDQLYDKDCIIVSDPPFNIGYRYRTYKDKMPENEYYEMLASIFGGRRSVIIHYPEPQYKLAFQMRDFPERVVSWVYPSNMGKQHRDICFYNVKPDFKKVRQPYKEDSAKTRRLIAKGSKGAKIYDWWEVNQVKNTTKGKTAHPCQMPLKVMTNVIGILPDDVTIIDPFMGSGTTGAAVLAMNEEQGANRKFIGIELDPEYYKICKERLQ